MFISFFLIFWKNKSNLVLEERSGAKQKRKTTKEDEGEEDSPSERDKRVRLRMNNNKTEKDNEQSEFTNHEEEVRTLPTDLPAQPGLFLFF